MSCGPCRFDDPETGYSCVSCLEFYNDYPECKNCRPDPFVTPVLQSTSTVHEPSPTTTSSLVHQSTTTTTAAVATHAWTSIVSSLQSPASTADWTSNVFVLTVGVALVACVLLFGFILLLTVVVKRRRGRSRNDADDYMQESATNTSTSCSRSSTLTPSLGLDGVLAGPCGSDVARAHYLAERIPDHGRKSTDIFLRNATAYLEESTAGAMSELAVSQTNSPPYRSQLIYVRKS